MEVRYCGEAWVADLTVEDANHYISECGLVNKNTRLYPEEMGTFPAEGPINKLQATLRSGNGVPCQMKGTCNPGGPGHGWVKARYRLDRHPQGYEPFTFDFTNPFTGKKVSKTRIFIPSRVTDNQYLGDDYVASLQMSGSESLVRAWLLGDWDVIEGAFFDCWRADRHVVEPFDIPEHWIKARSFDWGFAKPFSVGWWAVASEPTKLSNGLWLPRGGLVRFAEWYGAASPDVGMKLQASQIAEGIKYLEAGLGIEKVDLSIADTAIFAEAGASLGYKGPSIAEAMARAGVQFRPADKRRLLGWDQFRGRLIGDADKNPMVVVTTRCQDFIRTVPVLQHDKVKPEDLDTDGEDHCFTGDTLVSTSNGVYSIADLVGTTGLVWSGDGRLHGYRSPRRTRADAPVVKLTFSDGTIIRCTPDHRFLTTRGWVEAKSLSSLSLRPFRSFSGSATTGAGDTFSARASGFIARCGNTIAGLSRRATTFITGTMTEAGIRLATCSASPKAHTPGYTGWRGQTSRETSSSVPALLQQHGTAATPAGSGIASNIGFTVPRLCSRMWRAIAATAGDGSSGRSRANIVPTTASLLFDGPVASIMKAASAASAAWASWSADTQRSKRVPASAARYPAQGRERVCLSVEPDGRADVYCLTVPDTGNFVLASGVIVANCADEARYMMMARPWTAKTPEKREEMQGMEALTLDRLFDERESERRWR